MGWFGLAVTVLGVFAGLAEFSIRDQGRYRSVFFPIMAGLFVSQIIILALSAAAAVARDVYGVAWAGRYIVDLWFALGLYGLYALIWFGANAPDLLRMRNKKNPK